MRPSSCLGPQLPGSAFSCRSRQMVARLRKKRLFCSTTKKKKKKSNYAGGKKKKQKKPPLCFLPATQQRGVDGWHCLAQQGLPSWSGQPACTLCLGGGGRRESPQILSETSPHVTVAAKDDRCPLAWGCSGQKQSPECIRACRVCWSSKEGAGFPTIYCISRRFCKLP